MSDTETRWRVVCLTCPLTWSSMNEEQLRLSLSSIKKEHPDHDVRLQRATIIWEDVE